MLSWPWRAPARAWLASLALALVLAPGPTAQESGSTDPRFELASTPDFAVNQRAFVTTDTLHMRVRAPRFPHLRGTWSLERPEGGFQGELTPGADGWFTADFDLAELPRISLDWTWSARLEQDGFLVYGPTAVLAVTLPPPQADFQVGEPDDQAPLQIAFDDLSTGSVSTWIWDFGDGTTSYDPEPTHVYTGNGSYTVRLTVANAGGTSSRSDQITVGDTPDFLIRYGMNASENVWSQRGIAFADALARASEFCRVVNGSITPQLAPLVPLGEDPPRLGAGWPDLEALNAGELAGARLFGNMGGSIPDGRTQPYVLTWRGTGSCRLMGSPVIGEQNRGANRVEVLVDPGAGGVNALLAWVIDASSALDPVRDAHVWLPGMEAEQALFWPPFVEKLAAMNGGYGPATWRSMDWNQVRQYGRMDGAAPFVFDLEGRITAASPSQGTRRGVCPEFIVALCNEVGSNLHFSLPHAANNLSDADYEAFVRATLLTIRDGAPAVPGVNGGRPFEGLRPDRKLRLEFSNELWNPSYPVNAWLRQRAAALGLTLHETIARELERVFTIARDVFSGPDAARLETYVGGWVADETFLGRILSALDPAVRVDCAGPACYFKPRSEDVDAWLAGASSGNCPNCPTPEGVIASARLTIQELAPRLASNRAVVAQRVNADGTSPRFVLYEAGQAFVANFQPWGPASVQAQRSPSMFDAYVHDLVPMLIGEGVEEVLWYSFMADNTAQGAGAGPFGHWDSMDQTITLPVVEPYLDEGAPKAAAVYRLPPLRTP